jgi:hypothetical protein
LNLEEDINLDEQDCGGSLEEFTSEQASIYEISVDPDHMGELIFSILAFKL